MTPDPTTNQFNISIKTLKKAYQEFSSDVIDTFGNKLNENEREDMVEKCRVQLRATLDNVGKVGKVDKVKNTKKIKKRKCKVPIPFCGIIEENWCYGIKKNHNLYTQCTKSKMKGEKYCKICCKHAKNNSTGKPTCGDICDRKKAWDEAIEKNENPICWRPDGMSQELPYINITEKLGITIDKARKELEHLGWGDLPKYHLEKKVVRRGRPAKNKVAVDDSDDDTPKKKRGRPRKPIVREPTNEELIALMTSALS